jgi:hypothetical protein
MVETATAILGQVNITVASAIVLTTFSLLIYIVSHNLRSSVARAFSVLLGFVMLVYGADVMVGRADGLDSARFWLNFQWLGIAFVPAAYLHLSDALLKTTNLVSKWRRLAVAAGYGIGFLTLALVLFSDLLVSDRAVVLQHASLTAGPLFGVFAAYFFGATVVGALNIQRARRRALTSTMRRRMTYLTAAFVAPALGTFPYLLVATLPDSPILALLLAILLFAGNVAIALMLLVMAYSVAFFGVLAPDRVVKQSLVQYLLRGPLVGSLILAELLLMPKTQYILGLHRDTVLAVLVVATAVGMQVLVSIARPVIDRLVYRQDIGEMAWIQQLNDRLLTTTDLRQLFENVLTGICEQLRAESGFLATRSNQHFEVEAACGQVKGPPGWVPAYSPEAWPEPTVATNGQDPRVTIRPENLVLHEGYWLLPLRSRDRQSILGLLGVLTAPPGTALEPADPSSVEHLVATAETALENRHIQQGVFETLHDIIPQMEAIQRFRGTATYGAFAQASTVRADCADPRFVRAVRDALNHYWGGPRLTSGDLLRLGCARQATVAADGNTAKGMRALLTEAIERLKPDGARTMTSPDWLLYNILEMKFVQGRKVREIAAKLALSESDLYRKQRVAIEAVARQLEHMERAAK